MIQWKNSSRSQRHARDRRGQSLILIFFTLIALIGVLALTLDYGFILLARRQMQTGVNAAALEGARDIDGSGRQHAADLLRNIYDDDLDPTQNDTTIGAGIARSLIQGDGFQMMTIGAGDGLTNTLANRSSFVYRPTPELNIGNDQNGDFVQGDYDETVQPTEDANYDRADGFTPNAQGDAFLARLRRTHNPDDLDQVRDVSSSGGGLPLLIGNLAWFGATDPNARFSIRRDGVTVRATAIAQEQVAVRVWVISNDDVYGALPLNISRTDFLAGNLATAIQSSPITPTSIGEEVTNLTPASLPTIPGYIAIFEPVNSINRVIGFYLHDPSGPPRAANASPRIQDAWATWGPLTDADRMAIKNFHNDPTLRNQLVKAPAFVRSVP